MSKWTLVLLGAGWIAGCGDSAAQEAKILDPTAPHLGRSYKQWAAEWVKYSYATSPADECVDPIADTTGELCDLFQDPDSGVFFLNGTYGGPVRRKCRIPADSALFFPLVNVWGDNAGLPDEEVLSDSEVRKLIQQGVEGIALDSLYVKLDGKNLGGLEEAFFEDPIPYTVTIPPEPNIYTCWEIDGVEGDFDGYIAGAFAMLAPLSKGKHVLEFGGRLDASGAGTEAIVVDVTYELTVD